MKELTIANLIRDVEKKQFLLPTIQRGFVWETKKIETLFDSLMRGFPISSFLFWEVPDEDEHTFKFYDFVKDYNFYSEDPRSFAEFKKAPHMAVLDGQQRITSFYIGLKGSYIPKGKAETPQKLYLNLLKINADSDIGDDDAGLDNVYEFKFLTADDAAKRDAETFWFPVEKILDKKFNESADIGDFLIENNLVDSNTHSYLKLPYRILNRLWNRIKIKPVIEYHLESNKTLDEVLNIFVRINNGGKPVELSELLISLATAQLKDFDVENELINIVNEVNNIGGEKFFNVSNDFILKAFLVLCGDPSKGKESIKFTIENFKPQRIKKIRDEWKNMAQAIKSAVELVNEFGFNQRNFTSNNALIPLAQYIYLKGNNIDAYAADKGKMIHWFISATLNGIFSASTDDKLIKFRNRLNESHENFPIFEMLGTKVKSENKIADELIDALMSTNYKFIKNVLMALTILYDGKVDLSTVDVDHMFPKIKIKTLQEMLDQGVTDEKNFQTYYEKFCNALPNLQLLNSSENKKKSATYFSDWIAAKTAEERAKYMAENFVPDVDFRLVNFKNFIDARGKLIRKKLAENLKAHGVIYFSAAKVIPPIPSVSVIDVDKKTSDDNHKKFPFDAVTDSDGKIFVTILYEDDRPMAYAYTKNYKKIRLSSEFVQEFIDEGRAVKLSPKIFDDVKKNFERELEKIHNMALRIKKQFADAFVTSDGKFMIYADHNGVTLDPAAQKWNPGFHVVNKDLLTTRISLDIILQEVVPQNIFVEITKANVDYARKIAKTQGVSTALKYLESTQYK